MPVDDLSPVELADSMARRSGPLVASGRHWLVVREWSSFSARFVLLESGEDRIALKLGTNWTADEPDFVADETARLAGLMQSLPDGGVVIPEVYGVSSDPPALALSYVDGPRLFEVLGSLPIEDAKQLVWKCGAALGAFHGAQPAGDAGESEAMTEFETAARRAMVGGGRARRMALNLVRARSYRFSPNDFLLSGGRVVLLDPPHVIKYDFVHRDLGSFAMELHHFIVGDRKPRRGEGIGIVETLEDAFLDGYRSTGPIDPTSSADLAATSLFETARVVGVAYGRLRSGRLISALRAARWALWLRRRLSSLQ